MESMKNETNLAVTIQQKLISETKRHITNDFSPRELINEIKGSGGEETVDGWPHEETLNGPASSTSANNVYPHKQKHEPPSSENRRQPDRSPSISSLSSTSTSSSESSKDSKDSIKKFEEKRHTVRVKKHKEFLLTVSTSPVSTSPVLKITAVRTKIGFLKHSMRYVVTKLYTEQNRTDFSDLVREYDEIEAVNGTDLRKHKFNIKKYLTIQEFTNDLYPITLKLKRWDHSSDNQSEHTVKEITIEYVFQKPRDFRNVQWNDTKRNIYLRTEEFTGLFLCLTEKEDLLIQTINTQEKNLYEFCESGFVCLAENSEGKLEERMGMVFTCNQGDQQWDMTSCLVDGKNEVVVKKHTDYDIGHPDERFFLKYEESDGSQRYESLLYHSMCFKLKKSTMDFVMGKFGQSRRSLKNYRFDSFSAGKREIMTIMPCQKKGNNNTHAVFSIFMTLRNVCCCRTAQNDSDTRQICDHESAMIERRGGNGTQREKPKNFEMATSDKNVHKNGHLRQNCSLEITKL